MIKINYNPDTGRVIGFNLDTPHLIKVDVDPRQPLPDKYSFYAVVDGQFCIRRRSPTSNEESADKIAQIKAQIAEIEQWMTKGIDWVVKLICGDIKKTDTEWIQYLVQRSQKRDDLKALYSTLESLQNATDKSDSR